MNRYKVITVYDSKHVYRFDMMYHTLSVKVRHNKAHSVSISDINGKLVYRGSVDLCGPEAWRSTLASVGGFIAKEVTYNAA